MTSFTTTTVSLCICLLLQVGDYTFLTENIEVIFRKKKPSSNNIDPIFLYTTPPLLIISLGECYF